MKLPYGNADFFRTVKEGFAYIDRTAAIRDLEELGDAPQPFASLRRILLN